MWELFRHSLVIGFFALLMLAPATLCAQVGLSSTQVEQHLKVSDLKEIPKTPVTSNATSALARVPPAPYIPKIQPKHFGFFCRVESRIERKSGIAPRFRLGSTEYVNYLEGKRLEPQHQ